MELKDCREAYYYHTGKLGDIGRHLAFVGLALIWAFRPIKGEALSRFSCWAGALLIAGLALDVLQYVAGSIVWGGYSRYMDKKNTKEDSEFKAPSWINWPALTFLILKVIAIIVAYFFLIMSLVRDFWY